MRSIKRNIIGFFTGSIIIFIFSTVGFAQKSEPETVFKYTRNSDSIRTLEYSVNYTKPDAKYSTEVVGVPITFSAGVSKEKLGTIMTNSFGKAVLNIPIDQTPLAQNGMYSFFASIEDNSIVESTKDSLTVVDLEIEMKLELIDSVKTILFKTFEIDAKGQKVPVAADLVFYVPRTFSNLKVAESSSNENGEGEVEFPEGLPGDSLGCLTVIAKVEDNEKYANVEKSEIIKWGIATNYHLPKFQRALWTTVAPTWMIITLTILLLGVWGHYIYVIFKILSIRKEGKIMTND